MKRRTRNMAVVMARLISISLLILLSMMFLTEQATAQKDCLCWVNAKTGKPAADAPGGNSEVDLTDPDHAFQPSTGDNFYRDKATCRWINSKTGRPAADVPAGHSERDLLDPTRAFQPSTGDNFYRIIPCPVKTTAAFTPPSGETVQGERGNFFAEAGGAQFRETWTGTNIHIGVYFKNANEWKLYEGAYRSPTDVQIVNVLPITGDTMAYELIALSNGNVVNTSGYKLGTVPLGLYESPKKLIGDALYMLTTQNIFVSRDTAKTWTIDTIGLGGTPQDIAIDSQQFVYAIPRNGSNNGLFRQHPDTNIWRVITTLPAKANPNKIFIDRRNRIYLGVNKNGYRLLYRSVDRGASWQIDTVGIGQQNFIGFGDDVYGNVYAIANNLNAVARDRIYRSNGVSWTRIDAPLSALNIDSLNVTHAFTSISGDSILLLTSKYGVFSSTDQGNSWKESNDGIAAEQVHGLVLTPSNNFVATTNLGVFRRKTVDSIWTKTFPTNGYLGGQPLFRDNTGAIYTLGQIALVDQFNQPVLPRLTMKSMDDGATWLADTLGISILKNLPLPKFFVDETGTQHIVSFNNGSTPSRIYAKKPGQAWAGDSAGYSGGESYTVPQAFGSDGRGSLWMSTPGQHSPSLLKRPVTGGVWAPDTLGLGSEILNTFAAAKNGIVYAGGFAGVWRRNASGWSRLATPMLNATFHLPAATPAYAVSVDSTNALIACYSYIDALGNAIGYGVYSTTDDGTNWTNLGNVDTTTFVQFVSYGNVTYGLSYFDGVFVSRTGASGVSEKFIPASLNTLIVFPNPANSELRISYSITKRSDVVLGIFDITGKQITSTAPEAHDGGSYETRWDVRALPNGSYILKLTACGESVTKVVEIVR